MIHEVLEKVRLICDEKVQTSGNLWGWEWGGGGLQRGKREYSGDDGMFCALIDCVAFVTIYQKVCTLKI